MDFAKVLSRAWEITWRWKVLWILGFLASLGNGGGGSGSANMYTTNGDQNLNIGPWQADRMGPEFWAAISGIILGLVCLGLLIAIALWVVSVIARGGLIAGVRQIEDEGTTTFGRAWRVGVSRFWTLFGISFLTAIPLFILILIGVVVLGLGIATAAGFSDISEALSGTSILLALSCGAGLCCVLVPLGIVLDQIRTYAERAAILEGLGWIDAFKRGWQVIKENLGPTIILWLIFLAIGLVLAGVIIGGMVAVALPLVAIFAKTEPGPWLIAPLCCGGLLAMIAFSLIGAIIETFTSATWTLAYRELTAGSV